ncbi:hypothetical protein UFOVP1605_48 [uncultured Caudovirales phage]|uniref:Uncharacterized protein n=1 Tax=uncultured Caudovirales phage TaxID=2100421 RepID=A0A6J5SVY5_9CAUD|nr:hypothetical protein UFOVP1605_48 [uncultured Caudovirales phage]
MSHEIDCVIKIMPYVVVLLAMAFYLAYKTVSKRIERTDCIYWNYSETDGVKVMKPSAWKVDPITEKHKKFFNSVK